MQGSKGGGGKVEELRKREFELTVERSSRKMVKTLRDLVKFPKRRSEHTRRQERAKVSRVITGMK